MTTSEDYALARKLARKIAATFAAPKLYTDLKREREISRAMLDTDPLIERSRRIVEKRDENFGHGLRHLQQVAVDAGAVVQAESARMGVPPKETERAVFLVLLASMLHDVKRRVPDHANRSAEEADEILADFPLDTIEKQWIVQSIRNHEAFVEPTPIGSPKGQLLSDALYDADKFRWGPDNFTDTVWEMVSARDVPIRILLAHFPKGMEGVKKIATTFRSQTGMKYGPEFIDIGLAIGMKLYEDLMEQFPPEGE